MSTSLLGAWGKSRRPIDADFPLFSKAVNEKFVEMSKGELFVVDTSDKFYDGYLAAYPEIFNPIVKTCTLYDCQTCKQFIRCLGKVVGLKDGKYVTVWGDLDVPEPFKSVADRLDAMLRLHPIKTVFRTKEKSFGAEYNYDTKTNERHDHFWGNIAHTHWSQTPETARGVCEAMFQVMKRGLTELRFQNLDDVIDLIDSNALYRGEEHRAAVVGFRRLQREFFVSGNGDLFIWENLGNRNARFRNTVIGTLLVDLADGKPLEDAVKSFEAKVAPMNYKRPTAIITQRMVEEALETLTKLGLHGAVARRYARLSDVSVNDVLFVDNDSRGKMKDGLAAILESSIKKATPDLKNATKVAADEFVGSILPTAKSLSVFVENRHQGNFVSLTGADGPERLFKWGNNFAWSYDGDVTDSVKQRVKAAGGRIDCKLRVSLSWFNTDDLDLHAKTPEGNTICFRNKMGILDVDMNAFTFVRNPVENLAFNRLADGIYEIWVNQFQKRETTDFGFSIEVEFAGTIQTFSYEKSMLSGTNVPCFKLHVKDGELVKVESSLTGGSSSQDKWGIKTETLVPAIAVMRSPNHWEGNAVGAKHLIFALKDCKNPGSTRGVYNEFLRPDLEKHRKVFEVLGAKTKCPPSDEQVSGVGFTAARGDSVTVVVDGKRSYLLTF